MPPQQDNAGRPPRGFSPSERFLSLFTTLRPGEGPPALQLCTQSFALMFAFYLLKVIREPMILAEGAAELKAYATATQAGLLMFIVPLFAHLYFRLSQRRGKHHLIRSILLFFFFNLLAFGAAYQWGWAIAFSFYVWLGIFSAMSLALFWAFAADLFNLKSGQRIFPLVAAAAALGAYVGAAAAGVLDPLLGHGGVIYVAALLLLVPCWVSTRVEQAVPAGSRTFLRDVYDTAPQPILEGFLVVWRSRYLTLIAVFVILLNLVNTNGEYILAKFVTAEAARLAQLGLLAGSEDNYITRFYSSYQSVMTLLSFLIQLFLVSRIFDRIGIRGALYVMPVIMIANYSLIALLPVLAVARLSMIAENSVSYSLLNTTRHALFLPVTREEKYVGKQTIDTFFLRFGDLLSGALVFLASAVLGLGITTFLVSNIVLSLLLLAISRAIGRYNMAVITANLGNLPPVLARPIADLEIESGQVTEFVFEADTFLDPDEGDALRYQAFANHTDRLPGWIEFDDLQRRFRFSPAPASEGSVSLRVVARDYEGLQAASCFEVDYRRRNSRQRSAAQAT
jgi:AAA family ATP:ADP antiporter